jgi:hypothetical protein
VSLLERAVVDKNHDEEKWLEERRKGVTATEVSKLAKGQPAAKRDILAEKVSGERTFFGNKYTDWGLERELVISALLETNHGFEASDILFFAEGNSRHLATPDAIFLGEDSVLIAEIKTSKQDLHPEGKYFQKTPYMDQMQWQMYVCGATRCLFAWEQHNDVWVLDEFSVERPAPMNYDELWIDRDDYRIDFLVALADEFLAELDEALA